jgi:hypothetical protein
MTRRVRGFKGSRVLGFALGPLGNLCTSQFKLSFLVGVGIGIGIGIDAFHALFLGTSRPDTDTDSDSDPDPDSRGGATGAEVP